MKLLGKTTTPSIEEYERDDMFPEYWMDFRPIQVTTYWFLFLPVYRTTKRL